MAIGVLVPVKAFADAKQRLGGRLDASGRVRLAREMAAVVLAAAAPMPVWVVTDDDDVTVWAFDHGAQVVRQRRHGLSAAVNDAVDEIGASGIDRVVVAHADLPLATDLSAVVGIDGVTLVPDRHDDGTNVASIPTAAGFVFSYGPGSFRRHVTEAERIGLPVHVVRDHALGWDIDHPDDLTNLSWTFPANPR